MSHPPRLEPNPRLSRPIDVGERGMKAKEHRNLFLFLAVLLIGGCAVGPNYKHPVVETPEGFRFEAAQTTNSFGELPWWEVFKDPALRDLIGVALTNNYNLKQAVARVEQARQQVTVARAPLLPQIGYGGDIGRGKNVLFNAPV